MIRTEAIKRIEGHFDNGERSFPVALCGGRGSARYRPGLEAPSRRPPWFPAVRVDEARDGLLAAMRLDPDHAWVHWTSDSIERTTGGKP